MIGPGGAGKSTFATQLGVILGLEVIHLDALYWKPGWTEPPKHEWAATVDAALTGEAWIMDGNYSGTIERRLAACDTVIFLDLPPWTCVRRILKRFATYRNRTRPDMAPDCPEKFSLAFLAWVWGYRRKTRPNIVHLLDECRTEKRIVRLSTPRQIEEYLERARS